MAEIATVCPICGETDIIILSAEEEERYLQWQNRELLIQDALPNKTPEEREQLITGICPHCWTAMFGGKDDD